MQNLKFRVWDVKNKTFINFKEHSRKAITIDGHLYDGGYDCRYQKKEFIIQQFTGLQDLQGKDLYEGDVVQFQYFVGDFVEFKNKKEAKKAIQNEGRIYIGVMTWNEVTAGFHIVIGDPNGSHYSFPALYARNGEILGNVFENPELAKEKIQ